VSHPINPAKLLKQAEELAGVGAGRGRPSTTNHRRAVSTAYYALFHDINLRAARYLLPDDTSDEEVWRATRWIEHGDVRSVCKVVAICGAPKKPIRGLPKDLSAREEPLWIALSRPHTESGRISKVPFELHFVTVAFGSLHAARQSADYEHSAAFSKETAVGHVRDAELALEFLGSHATYPAFQRFFAWIFVRSSGFRR
jgi:hypothetical protein